MVLLTLLTCSSGSTPQPLLCSDRLRTFAADNAVIWGRRSAEIGHNGADLMIAALALRDAATVVTGNVSDFAPGGARIESPF